MKYCDLNYSTGVDVLARTSSIVVDGKSCARLGLATLNSARPDSTCEASDTG
jgi:hypothetical protein